MLKAVVAAVILGAALAPSCESLAGPGRGNLRGNHPNDAGTIADTTPIPLHPTHRDPLAEVMSSRFCGTCHPVIYAEHAQNTHGRAFTDPEPRLATGRFSHGDCIRCHTPRPIFETGNGLNPLQRHHNLTEGNTCMTCHWKPGVDYARFRGGKECKTAFHQDVGTVEACAACHRNHGTPYQWEKAPTGKSRGRTCMTCHMETVVRPVAVGQAPRGVRSHVFPGSRSDKQLRRAYDYKARIDGNEVVVTITNKGAGHNFPTELKQRSVESLVVVRDHDNRIQYRSRMVFRDPYKRPYGLMLPVNTQIPAGESREHRVPLKIAGGKVDCELHFKLYFPIEDHHPELARRLESVRLPFDAIQPSTKDVETAPEPGVILPENTSIQEASPANLVDFKRPPIGKTEVEIPSGNSPAEMQRLIDLFQFPVPEAQKRAVEVASTLGAPMVPYLIDALGSWDNKTWNSAIKALVRMGRTAKPALVEALQNDRLYVRVHARQAVQVMDWTDEQATVTKALLAGMSMPNAVDRATAAQAIGKLQLMGTHHALLKALDDVEPDTVRAAAMALAQLGETSAIDAITAALRRASYIETRRDLAVALANLGSTAGVPLLIEGLDVDDDLLRESFFEALFAVTGMHQGFDPLAQRHTRLEAIARIRNDWASDDRPQRLRPTLQPSHKVFATTWHLVEQLGGGAGVVPGAADGNDAPLVRQLVAAGESAVPALVLGLKFPSGFAQKRYLICDALSQIASAAAVPPLVAALRDPVPAVAAKACEALGNCGDQAALAPLVRYQDLLLTRIQRQEIKTGEGRPSLELLLAQAAKARSQLGDKLAKSDLIRALLAEDVVARRLAIEALAAASGGDRRGYDAEAEPRERREAARRWLQTE